MADINLLPEELREKEQKEIESVKKKPKEVRIEMTSPAPELKPQPLKQPRPSLVSQLFARKVVPSKTVTPLPSLEIPSSQDIRIIRPTRKIFHTPKPEKIKTEEDSTSLAAKFGFGSKQNLEAAPELPVPPEANESKEKKLIAKEEKVIEIKEKFQKPKRKIKLNLFGWLKFGFAKKAKVKDKAEKEPATAGPGGKVELVERKKAVFDINLIPKELAGKEQFELPKKLFLSGLVVFIAILIVGGAYLGFTWYQLKINREIGALKTEIKTIEDQIAEQEKSKLAAIDLQQRLNLIKDLLNKHVYWTKFFEQLEKYTIDEVYYANFSMAGTEKVTLAAVGKDYESVAKQLVAFQQAKDFITQVDINSASAEVNEEGGYNRVSFNIDLVFLPEVFYKPIK